MVLDFLSITSRKPSMLSRLPGVARPLPDCRRLEAGRAHVREGRPRARVMNRMLI
jgi:hypothetical protein